MYARTQKIVFIYKTGKKNQFDQLLKKNKKKCTVNRSIKSKKTRLPNFAYVI